MKKRELEKENKRLRLAGTQHQQDMSVQCNHVRNLKDKIKDTQDELLRERSIVNVLLERIADDRPTGENK